VERRVAFVTGASRGIGKAASLALAGKGYHVVVTARTVKEGESEGGLPLPGSLETTAREIRERGGRALPIRLDLLDPSSIEAAVEQTSREWGSIDLLLNNGIYTGTGSMDHFLDLDLERVETMFRANLFSQISLTQKVLPGMFERGRGIVINMVSAAGLSDPPAPAGQGGWGFAYAATKAAFHRMVGVLAVEHPGRGVRFHNVEPGFVVTEAMRFHDADGAISRTFPGAPPEVPAAVIAWLASDPAAEDWNGRTVDAQRLCLKLQLLPDWRPAPRGAGGVPRS
jgi:NAD(P)-dependent dehydrogenase (short-subunit alcohol dehydrogenase family)